MLPALLQGTAPFVACRAVMYNFPLHVEALPGNSKHSKVRTSADDEEAVPAQHLCLLVDVTASRLKRVGRYNLGRIIGKGAFGVVRLGQNTQSGGCRGCLPGQCFERSELQQSRMIGGS